MIDAIDAGDKENLKEELGDLMLLVLLQSQIAKEDGNFDIEAVLNELNEKLIRRHPHVFGDVKAETADEAIARWEKIKAEEKKASGGRNDLPRALSGLLLAKKVNKRLEKAGVLEKVASCETLTEDEAGKQLFDCVRACADAGIDPEAALRKFSKKLYKDTYPCEEKHPVLNS